jgi:hypothetical protein
MVSSSRRVYVFVLCAILYFSLALISVKIPKEKSEAVIRRRTDNAMAKKKRTKIIGFVRDFIFSLVFISMKIVKG